MEISAEDGNGITELTVGKAQKIVDKWIRDIGGGYFSELTNMVLLTEEVGELARVIARKYGDQISKKGDLDSSLSEEMADVMWVLICLANQCGINLSEALMENVRKKTGRDKERFACRREKNEN